MRGGFRKGAGRKHRYGTPTQVMRIPTNMIASVKYIIENSGPALPLYACSVSAGFPSPAEDYIEGQLNLNEYLIKRPSATSQQ